MFLSIVRRLEALSYKPLFLLERQVCSAAARSGRGRTHSTRHRFTFDGEDPLLNVVGEDRGRAQSWTTFSPGIF